MAVPTARFSKHPTLALRMFILAGLTSVTLCSAASVHGIEEAIKLYESNQFSDAVSEFEGMRQETMRDSRSAYYYALSLNAAGRTPEAVIVCKKIIRSFPKSEAARQAKVAIEHWPHFNFVSNASPEARAKMRAMQRTGSGMAKVPIDLSLGFLGLMFEHLKGQRPRVKVIFPETPASKCLKPDDLIMFIDGKSTEDLTNEEVYDLLVGEGNTTVSMTVERNNQLITNVLTRISMDEFGKLHPEIWNDYLRGMKRRR